MQILVQRLIWIIVGLIAFVGILELILFVNAWNGVEAGAEAAAHTASITADSSALQTIATNALGARLPLTSNGQMLFNPVSDLAVQNIENNQEAEIILTYHVPVLGPLQKLLGLNWSYPVSRTAVRKNDYLHNGLHAVVTSTPVGPVNIDGVQLNISGQTISMNVQGVGFGTTSPAGVPGTTMGNFFTFSDSTQGWSAGSTISGIPVTYSGWTNNLVSISGIQNFDKGTEVIHPGDDCSVTVSVPAGSSTYYFIANPGGQTNYQVTLSATSQNVPMQTAVTLTASASVSGDGTNGLGIYDATTGQYLTWSSNNQVAQLVSEGSPSSQDYMAYYGPQGNIGQALATSNDIGVTWGDVVRSGDEVSAVLYEGQNGMNGILDLFAPNLESASVNGVGMSGATLIGPNELQLQTNSMSDTSGVVTMEDGTQVPFTATVW